MSQTFWVFLALFLVCTLRLLMISFDVLVPRVRDSGMAEYILVGSAWVVSLLFLLGYGVGKRFGSARAAGILGFIFVMPGVFWAWWEIFDNKARFETAKFTILFPAAHEGPVLLIEDPDGQSPRRTGWMAYEVEAKADGTVPVKGLRSLSQRIPMASGMIAGGQSLRVVLDRSGPLDCRGSRRLYYGGYVTRRFPDGSGAYDEKARKAADKFFDQLERGGKGPACG